MAGEQQVTTEATCKDILQVPPTMSDLVAEALVKAALESAEFRRAAAPDWREMNRPWGPSI